MKTLQISYIVIVMSGMLVGPAEAGFFSWLLGSIFGFPKTDNGTSGSFNNKGSGTQNFGNAKINSGGNFGSFGSSAVIGDGGGTSNRFNNIGSGTQDFTNVKINSGANSGDRIHGHEGTTDSFNNKGSGTQIFENAKINSGGSFGSFGGLAGKSDGGGTSNRFNNHGSGFQDFTNVKINSGANSGDGRYGNEGTSDSFNNKGSGTQNFGNTKINSGGSFGSFGSSAGISDGGTNGWNFGTSHSFNNHGSGSQVYSGAVINSGFNSGDKNFYESGSVKDWNSDPSFIDDVNGNLHFKNNVYNSGSHSGDDDDSEIEDYNNWNFDGSNSFKNHGSGFQNIHGAVINSNGFSSSGGTTTFTGNNQIIHSGNGGSFGSWKTTWHGSVYNVKTERKQVDNKKCTEDMWIIERKEKLEKYFELECLANGQSRNVNNAGEVLLVGEQEGDFCVFTSKRNELYYMQKGKWKKCSFKSGNIQETDLTSNELDKVKERITKWEALFEKNRKEIERIGQMQGEAGNKYGEKMRKIGDMQRAEGDKTRRNNDEIRKLWEQEAQRQRGDQQKLNDVGRSTGWGSAYNRLLEEQQKRMNREQDRINQKQNDENERYNRENEKYTRMMEEERIKYEEECTKFEKLREQEAIRFDKERKRFINNGW